MSKHIVPLLSVVMLILGLGSQAFAEDICPEGTQKVIQPETQEVFCIGNLPPAESNVNANAVRKKKAANNSADAQRKRHEAMEMRAHEENVRKDEIQQEIREGGFAFDFGLGYAMAAAFELRVSFGYQFAQTLSAMSFGLYADLGVNFGLPNSVEAAVVPMVHVNTKIFRYSMGLGIGVFSVWGENDTGLGGKDACLELKPEIRFDWFLSRHAFLGVGMDMPLIFTQEENQGTEVQPWVMMNIHIGYLF